MASRTRRATASPCAAAARRTTNRIAMARIRRPDFARANHGRDVPGSPGASHTARGLPKSPHGLVDTLHRSVDARVHAHGHGQTRLVSPIASKHGHGAQWPVHHG